MSLLTLNGTEEDSRETCLSRMGSPGEMRNETALNNSCGVVWDGLYCWGPALPGSTVYLACPAAKGTDVGKQAYRHCDASGHWLNKDGVPDEKGWTNYTPCFTPEIFALIKRLYSGTEIEAMSKIGIARGTRILELFGLSLSFMALLLSLFVFYYFRSLRNPRTRLHRHLFIAMVIQVTVRLTLYIDQFIVRTNLDEKTLSEEQYARGIDNTPILCEAAYICLEYARTAMFMWMFVEGLYLHNMITVTVFEEKLSPSIYPLVGWVFPIPLTLSWAIVTAKHYGTATCWWGYNFTLYFWILEGPRLGVLVVNLAFLLNILRVLVTKLRQSNSSEAHQARKAVKAALVLLPLLGLTNLLNMLDAPLERSAVVFGLWSYTTHILTSCQGLILACLYCFWNGEVQLAVKKFIRYKVLNGCKSPGGGNRKCSVQMSPMNNNNNKGANRAEKNGVKLVVPQPHCVEILSAQGTTPQSQLIRLSPVNNIEGNIIPPEEALTTPEVPPFLLLPPRHENNSVKIVEDNDVKIEHTNNSLSCSNNNPVKISNNPDLIECGNILEGNKLRRVSKLRIWISPLILKNDINKKQLNSDSSSALSPKKNSVLEREDDLSELNSPELSSTEGCHFQIEYYDSRTGLRSELSCRDSC